MVSGTIANKGKTGSGCCGYGNDGVNLSGFDCVMIASATNNAISMQALPANAFCGRSVGLASVAGANAGTVCCEFMKMFS